MEQPTLTGQTQTTRGKACTKCRTWYPHSAFGKSQSSAYYCWTCRSTMKGSSGTRARAWCEYACAQSIGRMGFGKGTECVKCRHWHPWSAYLHVRIDRSQNPLRTKPTWKCKRCAIRTDGSKVLQSITRSHLRSVGLARCQLCKGIKPINMVGRYGGANQRCKECLAEANLNRYYGITVDDWRAMYAHQDGKCAMASCGAQLDAFEDRFSSKGSTNTHVDHCHDTGTVRGLLCANCNAALSKDRQWLIDAVAYLDAPPAHIALGRLARGQSPKLRRSA